MKTLLLAVAISMVALTQSANTNIDSTNFAQRQKDILKLFKFINQPSYYKEHVQIASSFDWHANPAWFTKPEVVEHFWQYYDHEALLEKGEIFSIFYEHHQKQAELLFKMFYYAKDYETFYKFAVWARNHLNEGLFLYTFSVALVHRPDTYYFALPPIYEIYPHYFYKSDVIQQAQYYKQFYGNHANADKTYVVYANYSGEFGNLHPEQSMAYFMEDVGFNSFYYYYNLYYPFWMDGEEFGIKYDNRGEFFFYMYQQILARFYLERLSNGFGEIEWFNWEVPFETGFVPSLRYPYGLEFPSRPNYAKLSEYFYNYGQKWSFKSQYGYSYTKVHDYEYRIREAIDLGYVYNKNGQKVELYSEEGVNILGNLVEGNHDSPFFRYYGAYQIFARHLLGYSYQPNNFHYLLPSALEHFETSLRDPAFYQLYKKLILYYYKYKYHVGSYKHNDLVFSGVKVEKMEVDRLVTYFDYFHYDLSNGIYHSPEEFTGDNSHFKVEVAQERLTHKPFTFKIYVDSEKDVDASVYVYLGPKYDEYHRFINITENWMNFVQFDHFEYKLKSGQNVISRNSEEIYNYIHDRSTYYELYQKAFGVYDKSSNFHFNKEYFHFGFPHNLMLPVGNYGGMEYQFFVFVAPYKAYKTHGTDARVGSGTQYVDGYPLGYPFDRPVYYEEFFEEIPNSHFHPVKVYYRNLEDINASTAH